MHYKAKHYIAKILSKNCSQFNIRKLRTNEIIFVGVGENQLNLFKLI